MDEVSNKFELIDKKQAVAGMHIFSDENISYIFLCGINPGKTIILNDSVKIEPVSCSPDPNDMIASIMKTGSKSEFELGMLISTLRYTTAQ